MTSSAPGQANYQLGPASFFVLVGSQRSGTNFLREVLNTHPNLAVHGEVLWPYPHPSIWHNYVRSVVSRALPPVLAADAKALVDDYFVYLADDTMRGHPHKASALRWVGVDIKYNQLRHIAPVIQDLMAPPFLLGYFRERQLPILHLHRRNLLHQALSMVIADQRNVYHDYQGRGFDEHVTVNPKTVIELCHWIRAERDLFRELGKDLKVLELAYEDVAAACDGVEAGKPLAAGGATVVQIAEFLGLPSTFARPRSISKVINKPYQDVLANHEEVLLRVEQSEFREFASTI